MVPPPKQSFIEQAGGMEAALSRFQHKVVLWYLKRDEEKTFTLATTTACVIALENTNY